MPIYEYKCNSCGEIFEKIQKFSDKPLTEHEGCGGPVERLVSPPGLHFKGSGWYITDYARSGGNGSNGKSTSGTSSSSENGKGKSAVGTESKADAK